MGEEKNKTKTHLKFRFKVYFHCNISRLNFIMQQCRNMAAHFCNRVYFRFLIHTHTEYIFALFISYSYKLACSHTEYILQPLILYSIIFLIWYIMRLIKLFCPFHSFSFKLRLCTDSSQHCSFPPSLKHTVNPSLSPHCYDSYSSSDATSQQLKTALWFSISLTSNQQHSHI